MMLTRRVHGGEFRLRPSAITNQIVLYVLAVMSARWNIHVHAATVLSNHWHAVVTDPDGNIVEFQRDTHHFITAAINAHHGEHESMWTPNGTSRVECEEPSSVIEQIAYTMANPVEAGLVRFGRDWPGVRIAWPAEPITIKKPPKYFRGEDVGGKWPSEVELVMTRPPGYEQLSDEVLAATIAEATDAREQFFRDQRDREGKTFLGAERVLAQSRRSRPSKGVPHFGLSPKFSCHNPEKRTERIARDKRWGDDYYRVLPKWRAGDREVEFPAGTYQMRVVHNVRCGHD